MIAVIVKRATLSGSSVSIILDGVGGSAGMQVLQEESISPQRNAVSQGNKVHIFKEKMTSVSSSLSSVRADLFTQRRGSG